MTMLLSVAISLPLSTFSKYHSHDDALIDALLYYGFLLLVTLSQQSSDMRGLQVPRF